MLSKEQLFELADKSERDRFEAYTKWLNDIDEMRLNIEYHTKAGYEQALYKVIELSGLQVEYFNRE